MAETELKPTVDAFNRIIDQVEARCMATDGPVTPTLAEMREDELAELWRAVGEAVAWQWRKRERTFPAAEEPWSFVDYFTGLKIKEFPEKYETRALYAHPSPSTWQDVDGLVDLLKGLKQGANRHRDRTKNDWFALVAAAIDEAASALSLLAGELREARDEAACCDDIKLNQPLAGIIADLQAAREALDAKLTLQRDCSIIALNQRDALAAEVERLTGERDRQYDENVNRIAAEGAAILRAETAESTVASLTLEVERLRKALADIDREIGSWECEGPDGIQTTVSDWIAALVAQKGEHPDASD